MTPPRESARLKLYDEARNIFSEEAADTLMESLPPIPFPDLATKADLDVAISGLRTELKDEMHAGFAAATADRYAGFARADAERHAGFTAAAAERHAGFAKVDADLRAQLYWTVGTMIALFSVLAGLVITHT